MYDRLLLPTDGSAGMERVIEHADDIAREHDATIDLLYVVNTSSMTTIPTEASVEGIRGLLNEEGKMAIEAAARICSPDTQVEHAIVEGNPEREIVDYAAESDCDLIVMGTHGRGGIDRLLLGSVAEHVVRRSDVPVLTVQVGEGQTTARSD
jgi:nucleotide-binding universal stress UspA family protein